LLLLVGALCQFVALHLQNAPAWCVPIGTTEPNQRPAAEREARAGWEAYAAGRFAEAEIKFRASLDDQPNSLEAILGLASIALALGQPENAVQYLTKARQLRPNDVRVHVLWSEYHVTQGKYLEAEAVLKQSIHTNQNSSLARRALGELYLRRMNKPEKAVIEFREAIRLAPADARAHLGLGLALARLGTLDQGQLEMQEAARLAPTDPQPFTVLGVLFASRKQYGQALISFDSAIKIDPNFLAAHLYRGDVFLEQGHPSRALAEYEKAKSLAPKSREVQERIAAANQAVVATSMDSRNLLNTDLLDETRQPTKIP
jgi:tetratricopeptide (TPR) repeat protein